MENSISFNAKQPVPQGTPGGGGNLLDIIDSMTTSFHDELAEATKNAQKSEKEKVTEKEDEQPEKVEQQESSPAESEEIAESAEAEVAEELLPIAEEGEQLAAEEASDEQPLVVENSEEEAVIKEDISSDMVDESAEGAEEIQVDGQHDTAPVTEQGDGEIEVDENATEGEEVIAAAGKESVQEDASAAEVNDQDIAPVQSTSTPEKQGEVAAAAEVEARRKIKPARPQQTQAQQNAALQQQTQEVEADADFDVDAHHSIQPKENAFIGELKAEEIAKVLDGLQTIANNTAVKSPTANRVSEHILNSLKANGVPIAQEIEKGQNKPLTVGNTELAAGKVQSAPLDGLKESSKGSAARFPHEGLEKMKGRIAEQVKMQMKGLIKNGGGKMVMKLNPHFLGEVKVEVAIEQSKLSAHFAVETQTVKEMLQRSLPDLEQSLKEHGIETQEVDVDISSDQSGDNRSGKAFASIEEQQAMKDWVNSFYHLKDGEGTEEVPAEEQELSDPNQIINIMA